MKLDYAYILSYVERMLPIEELRELDALLKTSPQFRKEVERILAICDLSDNLSEQKKLDAEKAWLRLYRRIKIVSFRSKIWDYARTTAAILLLFFLLNQYMIQPMLKTSPPEMITLVSAPGIVTKVVLPDGSEVWLNAQSELTYSARFSEKERTVSLKGEAYFKVSSDKNKRFNVDIPGDITISAFGTEFNVNAYPDDTDHSVTLVEGQVEVGTVRSNKNELTAGQKAVIIPCVDVISVIQADIYVETSWREGKMVFRRENLETISKLLSRRFGVEIILEDDELKSYEYTATFTDETLEDILALLKRSAPIKYSITRADQFENNTFSRRIVTIKTDED